MDEFDWLLRGDAFGGRPVEAAGGATRGRRAAHVAPGGQPRDVPEEPLPRTSQQGDPGEGGQFATSATPWREAPLSLPPVEVDLRSAVPTTTPDAWPSPVGAPPVTAAPLPVLVPLPPGTPPAAGGGVPTAAPPVGAPSMTWSEPVAPEPEALLPPQVPLPVAPPSERAVPGVSMPGPTPMPPLPYRPGDEEQASKHAWMGPDGLVIPGHRSPSDV